MNAPIMEQIERLEEEMRSNRVFSQAKAINAIRAIAQRDLFDRHPVLTKIGWIQYEPEHYYSDAGTRFGPQSIGMRFDGDVDTYGTADDLPDAKWIEHSEHQWWFSEYADLPETQGHTLQRKVEGFVRAFTPSDLEDAFGGGAVVVLSRDGIGVVPYTEP